MPHPHSGHPSGLHLPGGSAFDSLDAVADQQSCGATHRCSGELGLLLRAKAFTKQGDERDCCEQCSSDNNSIKVVVS
ncbi:hypothetical protein [Synechococcus sp. MIT S9508]|uniref:hypothetical protein n=1 Tax=Synechococcus sp. MIT S9508 TaxID=1801629 RepID=UPI0012E843E2|nr:hypothetical protein [Synechococcus sp. MIT S9508]